MKTPGNLTAPILTGMILGTTLALFTVLPISPTDVRTLGESIFGRSESQKVNLEK
jgi:hypothetical protein